MDNSNTNWPNNPNPSPVNGTPPQPVAPTNSMPTPPQFDTGAVNPLDVNSVPSSTWPTTPVSPLPPLPSSPPLVQPDLSSATAPAPTWTPSPLAQPTAQPTPMPDQMSSPTWPNIPSAVPTPTMPNTNPTGFDSANGSPALNTSPLDNPWGAPSQAPAIDGNPQTPQSTWPSIQSTPSSNSMGPEATPQPTVSDSTSTPTDLSHLISNNSPMELGSTPEGTPPTTSAETLVVPPATATPEVPNMTSEGRKGVPKWLIGVGIGLLIMVAGASAYFILGVGQAPKATTSVPAEVTKPTVKTPPPIATAVPQTNPAATGSANFGELQGNASASAKPTRAGDLIK